MQMCLNKNLSWLYLKLGHALITSLALVTIFPQFSIALLMQYIRDLKSFQLEPLVRNVLSNLSDDTHALKSIDM